MLGVILSSAIAVAMSAAAMSAAPAGEAAVGATVSALVEPVQYRERSRSAGRDSVFEPPTLRQQGSLFRARPGRVGPHYEPPPVVYEPPAVTYEPPSVGHRIERGRRSGRCVPRTRAWYDYCAARFRSFNPNRGTYTAFSGQERPCRCP